MNERAFSKLQSYALYAPKIFPSILSKKQTYVSAECRAHYQYIKLYTRHEKKDSQFLLLVRMYCGLHEAHVYEREVDTETEEI